MAAFVTMQLQICSYLTVYFRALLALSSEILYILFKFLSEINLQTKNRLA